MTTEELREHREYLKKIVERASVAVARSPEGRINIGRMSSGRRLQFTLRRPGCADRYLSKRRDAAEIMRLLNKHYNNRILKVAVVQLDALEKFMAVWDPDFIQKVNDRYPEETKDMFERYLPLGNKPQTLVENDDHEDVEFARNLIRMCESFISGKEKGQAEKKI